MFHLAVGLGPTKPKLVSGSYKLIQYGKHFGGVIVEGDEATVTGKSLNDAKGKLLWDIGLFGDANKKITEITEQKNYNIEITCPAITDLAGEEKVYGVLSQDGKKVVFWCFKSVCELIWMTENEATKFRSMADSADAPSSHYKLQPGNLGKLIWVTGPPGHGKSTTAHMFMEKKGYVYYEGDGFMFSLNPFIPPSEGEALDALFEQNDLKGLSKERISITQASMGAYQKMSDGEDYDGELMNEMYREMSRDIQVQRKRMGGDWAVCQAIPTRAQRDVIRSILGPELIFVVLEMSKEMGRERLNKRGHLGEELVRKMEKMGNAFEPAMEDEPNTIALKLTRDMTPILVVEKILSNDLLNK